MKTARYHDINGKLIEIEYDENTLCIVCGEPVLSASMGGTDICPSCDCGKCRYCGKRIFVLREEIDGGITKREVLKHMKLCREAHPDVNKRLIEMYNRLEKDNEELRRKSEVEQK